jgi:hypothetical protein
MIILTSKADWTLITATPTVTHAVRRVIHDFVSAGLSCWDERQMNGRFGVTSGGVCFKHF